MATASLEDYWHRFKRQDDRKARDAIIANYGYLVKITAGRIAGGVPPSLDREDLIAAGVIGLIKAVDQFDATRKVKFETYAIALIRGAILELLRSEDWAPRSVRDRIKQLQRAYAAVEMRLGRPGTEQEIAAELDISVEDLYALLSRAGQASVLSLDETLYSSDAEGSIRIVDTIRDDQRPTPDEVVRSQGRQALAVAMRRLPEREHLVLSLYYYEGMTFKEIGKLLKVSESRVFQLHQQAKLRLRGYLSADTDLFRE